MDSPVPAISTSAFDSRRHRRLHEPERLRARPLRGSGKIADLAAGAVDQDRGGKTHCAADPFQFLKYAAARILVIAEILDPDVGEKSARLCGVAGINVDGDDREVFRVDPRLQPIECG